MSSPKCIVVGSGPSGVAASKALLEGGADVTMLDVGHRLEPERRRAVEKLAAVEPENWDRELVDFLKGDMEVKVSGLPQKLVYGSEFAYADPHHAVRLVQRGTELFTSQALGGLSNVWGSNLLPFLSGDMGDWPVAVTELAAFYGRALGLMPYSAVDDSLAGIMPLHADHRQDLRMSRQAEEILADLEKNRSALSKKGVAFGRSRLAVDAANCRYCGMCLYGCPYNLIYSSATTLEELQRHPAFRYSHSLSVESVSEKDGGVFVVARSLPSGETETLQADRIFLAAGAVGTAKILMRSLGIFDREIEFQDSQYFLAPMVRSQRTASVETERLHTLSQIALVVRDADIGPKSVEMLIYTYNDMFERALAKLMPVQTIRRMFLSRTFVVQGYLPSELSDPLLMSLSRSGELNMSFRENPLRKTAMRKAGAKLRSIQSAMGAFQVPGFTQLGAPGKSYHIGASFPMKQNPEALETDILGRLPAFGKVHLVDASCLPSIPSTNITLSVMANAMRIAEAAMQS